MNIFLDIISAIVCIVLAIGFIYLAFTDAWVGAMAMGTISVLAIARVVERFCK